MRNSSTRTFVILSLLVAVVIVLGYLSIPLAPGLALTFNMIPVAIAAIALGPTGGAVIGLAFGLVSFLQCFGIFGSSPMGVITLGISPVLTFIQRVAPRLLDGALLGLVYNAVKKKLPLTVGCALTGFLAAFLNTIFFMTALVVLFKDSAYMQEKMAGLSPLAYVLASIGAQAVVEMITSTILTGAIGTALTRARLIEG